MPDPPHLVGARNILDVRGAAKRFGGLQALGGVDLDVREGEILGLVGPNGSGKTTLINVISGFYPLTGGSIKVDGAEIGALPAHAIARRGVARTYQIPRPFVNMSVLDNVAMAATFGGPPRSTSEIRDESLHWIGFTGLAGKDEALPAELNRHERKFLELARALAARPKLLISDEAMAGLAGSEVDEVLDVLFKLNAEGITVIMIEHIMQAVMRFSERVMCLDAGRVICEGSPQAVMDDKRVQEAYLGA